MADRELPPLRVKLIGDDSSYKSMMDRASKQADDLARRVAKAAVPIKAAQNAGKAAIREVMSDATKFASESVVWNIKKMMDGVNIGTPSSKDIKKTMEAAVRMSNEFIVFYIKKMVDTVHTVSVTGNKTKSTLRYAVKTIQEYIIHYIKQMIDGVQNITASGGSIRAEIRRSIRTASQAIVRATAISMTAAANTIQTRAHYVPMVRAELQRIIRAGLNAILFAINNSVMQAATGINHNAINRQINAGIRRAMRSSANAQIQQLTGNPVPPAGRGGRTGGGGGGFGLGGRADIYMGTHGIRNIMGAVAGPAQSAMDFQDAGIAMTAYTGSAEKAAAALKDVQEFALMSPYSSRALIDNSKSMMAYGMSSEDTLNTLKQLGAVAGGNSERMHLLAYAMAQVNSAGILQGQELRQLQESGFNPLMVIAEDMTSTQEEAKKKFIELRKAMSEGRITAEMVAKSLDIVNAKGGDFAGLLDKLNNSTRGLTNQFLEYADLIQRNLFASIQDQIDEFLKTGVAYMKMISDMISQNKELAKSIATWVWRAIVAVTAILAFTVVMAAARWMVHAMIPLLGFAYSGFMLLARGAIMAWTAILGPYAAIVAAIVAIGIAIAVLIAYFYHPGGIIGAFGDMMSTAQWALTNTLGFFWNFGENVGIICTWIGGVWFQMWANMFAVAQNTLTNVGMFFSNLGGNIMVSLDWIGWGWQAFWGDMFAGTGILFNNFTNLVNKFLTWAASIVQGWGKEELNEAYAVNDSITNLKNKSLLDSANANYKKQAEIAPMKSLTDGMVSLGGGVGALPGMQPLNLGLDGFPTLPDFTPPKYEESNTPIPDKEIVDWESMMGAGKPGGVGGRGGAASLDIKGYARGSADAEARARAFMAGIGKPISSTSDRKLSNEEKMAKLLRDIERNTRHPIKMDTATIN